MAKQITDSLVALGPITLPDGRDVRSGDAFDFPSERAQDLVDSGWARRPAPEAAEPAKAKK